MIASKQDRRPAVIWTMAEGRVILELMAHHALRRLHSRCMEKGDGHPVMVLPGFLAGDSTTRSLRRVIKDLGYNSLGWELGSNKIFNAERREEFGDRVEQVYKKYGRKISLVGWSLGGLFAREGGKIHPEYVRNVISLGTPVTGKFGHSLAYFVYRAVNGDPAREDYDFHHTIPEPPPVPSTSIYTKSDGIVHWEHCLQPDSPLSENIRLPASHSGLGCSPMVMNLLADRLAQPEENWSPFEPQGVERLIYN